MKTEKEMLIKYHAKKIIDVFGKLVEGVVGHAEMDSSLLERLGRNHFHYGVKVDDFFVRINFNLFIILKSFFFSNNQSNFEAF